MAIRGYAAAMNTGNFGGTIMTLKRRDLFTGVAALGATAALSPLMWSAAKAAAPPAGTQNAGWYRYKVGSTEVTVATDGRSTFKFPDNFVANQSRDKVNEALAAAHLE